MRIAVDIDSTLHDYWGVLSEISVRRFGVQLPYEEQLTWGLTRLRPEQLALCVKESHCDERILAGVPYPGAVESVRDWRERGHTVYIASSRHADCHQATLTWLQKIELPFDELLCSAQKLERCLELGVELLVDDSPMSILGALGHGIRVATIVHPWNEEVCEEEDVICAPDWPELARRLAPVLAGGVPAGVAGRASS